MYLSNRDTKGTWGTVFIGVTILLEVQKHFPREPYT